MPSPPKKKVRKPRKLMPGEAPITRHQKMALVTNFRDSKIGIPALTDERFRVELESSYGNEAKLRETHSTGEYGPVHNWAADPQAGSLLSSRPRFGPDILPRIYGWRALSDSIQDKWAARAKAIREHDVRARDLHLHLAGMELQ